VPAVVVSPWARPHHVSHRVRDHTAILRLIETKWNLPALTLRDAHANDLLDCRDFRRTPFLEPPSLPVPGLVTRPTHCMPGAPGPIPPALTARIATNRGFGSVPLGRFLWDTGR
jgi:phospholipase C